MTDAPPQHEAWGLFALLRHLEQRAGDNPRIGRNATLRQEIAAIGQDPFLAFPETELSEFGPDKDGRIVVRNRVIGFFGPHGALPLNTTEEVYRWLQSRDMAFVRFTDIFAARFQQLYFRVWSDARAITQFDHATGDRFRDYLGAVVGMGTPAFQNRGVMDDLRRVALVPIALGRVKSAAKLRQMLESDLRAEVGIDEHQPSWFPFEPENLMKLGQQGSTLGRDCFVGSGFTSVSDRITIHLRARSYDDYRSFLPGGTRYARLRDIVNWYLGRIVTADVVLSLPADQVRPAILGQSTEVGWMAVIGSAANSARPAPDAPTVWLRGASYPLQAEAA